MVPPSSHFQLFGKTKDAVDDETLQEVKSFSAINRINLMMQVPPIRTKSRLLVPTIDKQQQKTLIIIIIINIIIVTSTTHPLAN